MTDGHRLSRSILGISRLISDEAEIAPYHALSMPLSQALAVSELDKFHLLATE
jgi:hypothetical protein